MKPHPSPPTHCLGGPEPARSFACGGINVPSRDEAGLLLSKGGSAWPRACLGLPAMRDRLGRVPASLLFLPLVGDQSLLGRLPFWAHGLWTARSVPGPGAGRANPGCNVPTREEGCPMAAG